VQAISISGIRYNVLPEERANERRADAIANPDIVSGIDKLAGVLGNAQAGRYFSRFLDNLAYDEVDDIHKITKHYTFKCPCDMRRKHNPLYVCWGDRCSKGGT